MRRDDSEIALGARYAPFFERDSLLFADDDPGGKAFFLLHGSLQMLKSTNRGPPTDRVQSESDHVRGRLYVFFGRRGLAEVRGIEPGQVLIVEREQFELLTRQDPAFGEGAWNGVAHCMAHLHNLVAQLSFNKVAERVVTLLLDDTAKDGDLVRLTQSDLAANVGTTREVVARCLAGLQADGLIRLGRGRVTVLHRERLRQQF